MHYRTFGKDGWKVSVLGFGAMRLPSNPDGKGVDVDLSIRLIRRGIDLGINYIDTAYIYHDGESEGIVAQALDDGYRAKVRVATKSPGHLITKADDFDRILDKQLARLRTDHIDYYLFHGIGDVRTELNKRTIIPCTGCRYCMPCPYGIEIPWNLTLYNEGKVYDAPGAPRFAYRTFMKPHQRAGTCVGCRVCESRCPQRIAISDWMPRIRAVLGENGAYPQ